MVLGFFDLKISSGRRFHRGWLCGIWRQAVRDYFLEEIAEVNCIRDVTSTELC